jgi:hypothetical protein
MERTLVWSIALWHRCWRVATCTRSKISKQSGDSCRTSGSDQVRVSDQPPDCEVARHQSVAIALLARADEVIKEQARRRARSFMIYGPNRGPSC